MDKKKLIPVVISASALGFLGVTAFTNKEITFNENKVIDITKSKDDDSYTKYRYSYSENSNALKENETLELLSYKTNLDKESLQYTISLTFKNISDKALNDINIDFCITGPDSSFHVKSFSLGAAEKDAEFTHNITLSQEDLLNIANSVTPEDESLTASIISNLVNNEGLGLVYEYSHSKNKNTVQCEVSSAGKVINKSVHSNISVTKELKSKHVENGSYLNLVKPEDKYKNQLIETQSVTVDIDKNFNFTIKAKFKNISDTTIDAFRFEPCIILGNINAPDSATRKITVKDSIKAGKEFEISVTYTKEDIQGCLEFLNKNEFNAMFYRNEDKLIRYFVENRFISASYTYNYENSDMAASVEASYSRSGKLDTMRVNEYKIK